MEHVSLSILEQVFAGIPLLQIGPMESLPIMADCHELTLLTLPTFIQVAFVVAAKIVLLWSIIAPTG